MEEGGGNIRVVIRIRPPQDDSQQPPFIPWSSTDRTITQLLQVDGRQYPGQTFQFGIKSLLFNNIARDIIDGALEGINGTVFAYGQTSAGKTFTMQGPPNNPGIIPLGLAYFFQKLEELKRERLVNVRLSYLEVYNEIVGDLLDKDKRNLKIHETLERGVFVGGLAEITVHSLSDALDLVRRGEEARKIGRTNMNEYSSRSHTVLRVEVESRSLSASTNISGTRSSTLAFVDLAGSERSGQMGNEGTRLKEGGHINKSLLTLATVISKLAENSSTPLLPNHIPYRDSKLTRILQPALGGNARCAIICAVTPSAVFADETLSTLKFASRAKAVKSRIVVNEVITDEDVIRCYREQVEVLKGELGDVRKRAADVEVDLEKVKRSRQDIEQRLEQSIKNCLKQIDEFKVTASYLSLIFVHISGDLDCSIKRANTTITSVLTELQANLQFLTREREGSEYEYNARIDKIQQDLSRAKAEKESSERQLLETVDSLRLKASNLETMGGSCKECRACQQEACDLDQIVSSLENMSLSVAAEYVSLKKEIVALQDSLHTANERLQERERELAERQSDSNELLDKLMQSKSDYTFMREQLSGRIDELNDEAEHWRQLGNVSGEKMEGVMKELEESSLKRQELQLLLKKSESESDTLRASVLERELQVESLCTRLNSLANAKEEADRLISDLREELSSKKIVHQSEIGDREQMLEKINAELGVLRERNSEFERQLSEASIREQADAESHGRKVQTILDRLEAAEKQNTDLLINYNALVSSSGCKEAALSRQVKEHGCRLAGLEEELKESQLQAEEAREKLREQVNINTAVRTQLETDLRSRTQGVEQQLEALTREHAALRRTADESSSMVELLRGSLKSRQDQHEQTIEELSRVRQELARLGERSAAEAGELERELFVLRSKVTELEKMPPVATTAPVLHEKDMIRLRVELERVKEGAAKDRKIAQLRIADLEEQLTEVDVSRAHTVNMLEQRTRQAELDRDSETAKVRQLQEAIKQLTADRERLHSSLNDTRSHSAAQSKAKQNTHQPPQPPASNKENECLQQ